MGGGEEGWWGGGGEEGAVQHSTYMACTCASGMYVCLRHAVSK